MRGWIEERRFALHSQTLRKRAGQPNYCTCESQGQLYIGAVCGPLARKPTIREMFRPALSRKQSVENPVAGRPSNLLS